MKKKNLSYEPVSKLPPFELELILAHILKKSREYVLAHPEIALNKAQKNNFDRLVKRRENHEPLAYLLGHKEFYGLDFKVTRDTLIPRPETEMLVEEVLKKISEADHPNTLIDVGTGSGNIIVSIARSMEHIAWNREHDNQRNLFFYGVDTSSKALDVAKQNARKHMLDKKIKFIKSDALEYFINHCSMFHVPCSMLIVANLPYLSRKIYTAAAPDVKNFEPKSALLSGADGLDHYRKLFRQMNSLEAKSYKLTAIFEFSPEQKPALARLVKRYFPQASAKFQKDLAGKWRTAEIEL